MLRARVWRALNTGVILLDLAGCRGGPREQREAEAGLSNVYVRKSILAALGVFEAGILGFGPNSDAF